MVPHRKLVVLGLLGTTLDQGIGPKRWEHWRPTVALCQHESLLVHRFELLHPPKFTTLAEVVKLDLARVSPETEVRLHSLTMEDPWDLELVYERLYDFARAYPFAPEEEEYLVHITTGTHIAQICMFLLTESRHLPARLVQTGPPSRETRDGPGTYSIIDLDLSKYDRLAARFQKEQREGLSFLKSGIDTRNRAFNELVERIEHVATHSRDPILLLGPTGSGKSALARRIFELKKARRMVEREFVEVNCATLRGDAATSTLFGHVKGAFTGALSERAGMLKKADAGILFLDEVGELGEDEQAMLLRAIEQKSFYPMGSDRETRSDFQLIAGTNRPLGRPSQSGERPFREDLLARINLWTFRLPALRERPEDMEPNLEYELEACTRALNRRCSFSREAREAFLAFATSERALWLGNFRDFSAAIRRMATLSSTGRIGVSQVEEERGRLTGAWSAARGDSPSQGGTDGAELTRRYLGARRDAEIDSFDRAQLEHVLRVCAASESLSEAGRRLFDVSRTKKQSSNDADRLRKYLARYELDFRDLTLTL